MARTYRGRSSWRGQRQNGLTHWGMNRKRSMLQHLFEVALAQETESVGWHRGAGVPHAKEVQKARKQWNAPLRCCAQAEIMSRQLRLIFMLLRENPTSDKVRASHRWGCLSVDRNSSYSKIFASVCTSFFVLYENVQLDLQWVLHFFKDNLFAVHFHNPFLLFFFSIK